MIIRIQNNFRQGIKHWIFFLCDQETVETWNRCVKTFPTYTENVESSVYIHKNLSKTGLRALIYRWVLNFSVNILLRKWFSKVNLNQTRSKIHYFSKTFSDSTPRTMLIEDSILILQWRPWHFCSLCGYTRMDQIPWNSCFWWVATLVCWWSNCRVSGQIGDL